MKNNVLLCQCCGTTVKGRSDKKYCSTSCKNAFNAELRKENFKLFSETESILRKNYGILISLLGESKEITIHESVLDALRFQKEYVTRIFKNAKGETFYVLYNCAWKRLDHSNEIVVFCK